MWWMPIAMFAQNKMAEKEAAKEAERKREEARKLQIHSISSSLAGQYGSPGYGEQAARGMFETESRLAALKREQDARRRQENAQMIGSALNKSSQGTPSGEGSVYGAGSAAPMPEDEQAAYDAELDLARTSLRGYR